MMLKSAQDQRMAQVRQIQLTWQMILVMISMSVTEAITWQTSYIYPRVFYFTDVHHYTTRHDEADYTPRFKLSSWVRCRY
jgi:hypothetical protein